eukprot:Skav208962  [mRNA]  locus=scaffold1580:371475:385803:- [translate_table: standard]
MLRLIAATLAISMALRGPPSPKYAAEPEEGKSWVDSYPAIDDDDIDWDQDKYQKAVMAVEEAEDMDGEKYQKEEAEDMDGEKYQKAVEEADGTMLVEEDKIVDVTQAFSKGVFTDANQQRYRCCKLWKNDWGIVVPEKTGKKEPLLSGCKGLLGIFYKSFNQYKEGNCTVFKSALPTALSKQDFPVRHRVMGKVRVQQHPGSFWHLRVAVVESRNDHYLKNVRVQAISTGDNPYFQDGKVKKPTTTGR